MLGVPPASVFDALDMQLLAEEAADPPGEGGILGEEVFGHDLPWAQRRAWLQEAGIWDAGTP